LPNKGKEATYSFDHDAAQAVTDKDEWPVLKLLAVKSVHS
jgi:hypothetical protein